MGNLLLLIHNPSNINILTDAKRRYPILEQPENMKKLLQPEDIISSRRQASNLKHLLINQGPIHNARGKSFKNGAI